MKIIFCDRCRKQILKPENWSPFIEYTSYDGCAECLKEFSKIAMEFFKFKDKEKKS